MNKSYANVKTALPGPKAKELLKRRHDIVPEAVSYGVPTFVDKADSALLQDVDGNRFIDFAGAIGTINAGHRHPTGVKALDDQVARSMHSGCNLCIYNRVI